MKSAHLASVVVFVGSIVCTHLLSDAAERDGDATGRLAYLRAGVLIDKRLTAPSAGFVTATGLALLWFEGEVALQQLWVWIAVGLWAASAAVGVLYLAPTLLSAATGAVPGKRWSKVNRWVLGVQAVILLLMIFRPTI